MFCYIILHYKNIEETLICIDKLKNIIKSNSKIIIVDNNTLSVEQYKELKSKVDDVILLKENIGFAKANNKGVIFAKEKYNPDYFVVMNNDVLINQKNFESSIKKVYNEENFDMLGPCISSPTGESVNPFPVIKNIETLNLEINKCKKLIKIYSSSFLYLLLKLYIKIKHIFKNTKDNSNAKNRTLNAALHGCCIIFSKKYIDKYNFAFNNETFLFHEEELLYQRIIKNNLISVYDPNVKIFHMEGSSMKKNNTSKRNQKLFREKERYKSLLLLKEVMNEKISS